MESNAFGTSHLPSQALVVLSEAASGLHEALRGQRPFPTRLPDAKDLHNMSLVGSYGTHLLHSFHPHLLQTLNHGMLANGGPASYFASERGLGKPSMLSNFQLPSAFSPPKYIGISLDQNIFNGNESFRTDSASPTCTSHESMEGSNDYDGEKGESPRSNTSDPRDLRHVHNKASTSSAASAAATNTAASTTAATSGVPPTSCATTPSHLSHHHPPLPTHHHHHHHHHPNGSLLAATMGGLSMPPGTCTGLRGVPSGHGGGGGGVSGLLSGAIGHVPDICPVCGIKLTPDDWNSHFLTELDRLYKLSSGLERTNLQATYMFAPPSCPAQENAIRTSHNRWETFQRIRNNRQNRLRIKVRKRKYGNELYFMENLFCSSCPICKRKYAIETGKLPPEDDPKMQEDIETVDVESCNDDVPDSGSEMQSHHMQMAMSGSAHSSGSSSIGSSSNGSNNMHNNNNQPGKLDGILYRTACVINKENGSGEDDVTATSSSSSSGGGGGSVNTWSDSHHTTSGATPGHISVKNVSELSSTTHHFYNNADSCGGSDERIAISNAKDMMMDTSCTNDSDEDVIVDDDDSIKMTTTTSICKKRKYEEIVGSSRLSENHSPQMEERPRSEPQVTSTEPSIDMTNMNNNNNNNNNSNNNNNINNNKYNSVFEELRVKQQQQHQHQQQQQQQLQTEPDNGHSNLSSVMGQLTQLDTKVGMSSENKPDDENKCFICKTGIKDLSTDSFFRGRNLYFHQSCANVMSSYRLSKEMQHQQQQQQQHDTNKSPTQNVTTNANN